MLFISFFHISCYSLYLFVFCYFLIHFHSLFLYVSPISSHLLFVIIPLSFLLLFYTFLPVFYVFNHHLHISFTLSLFFHLSHVTSHEHQSPWPNLTSPVTHQHPGTLSHLDPLFLPFVHPFREPLIGKTPGLPVICPFPPYHPSLVPVSPIPPPFSLSSYLYLTRTIWSAFSRFVLLFVLFLPSFPPFHHHYHCLPPLSPPLPSSSSRDVLD